MAEPAADYADGSVHTLTMGGIELRGVLDAAAQRGQLVVVDFSASWCGPCKAMVPVLREMAAEFHGRVVFCKVDCEETPRNRELAAEAGITAFPTFHAYRAGQRVAEFRGANKQQLRQVISQQLPLLAPVQPQQGQHATAGSGSGAPSAPAGPPGPMAAALAQALGRVRAGCSYEEFVAAARTLLTFVSNILQHPGEPKYRRIRLSNAAYQSKLGSKPGGAECMAALGFKEQAEAEGEGSEASEASEGGEGRPAARGVLFMESVSPELAQVKALLEQAIPGAGSSSGSGAAAAVVPGAPAAAAAAAAAAPAAGAAGAPTQPWAAGAGRQGASAGADPAALARMLAAMMGSMGTAAPGAGPPAPAGQGAPGGAPAAGHGAGPAGGGGAGRVQAQGRRVIRLTPTLMARMLEKLLRDGGFGAPPPGPQA